MSDYISIHTDNAMAYLANNGVKSPDTRRKLLSWIKPKTQAFGAAYYLPDDLDAMIDYYHDYCHELHNA